MTGVRALETSYQGYRMRSRLEARWAVFFDRLHLAWEYEPEGYALPSGECYLPDFLVRVPDAPCITSLYIEAKPAGVVDADELNRAMEFAVQVVGDSFPRVGFVFTYGDPANDRGLFVGTMSRDGATSYAGDVWISHVLALHFGVAPETYKHAALACRTNRFESSSRIGAILAGLS